MIIGITGGVGSGKSIVTDILRDTGKFIVLRTDDIARDLMNEDGALKNKLISLFGPEIYDADGTLNKKKYASMIYSDPENLKRSNDTVHPAVWKKVRESVREAKDSGMNTVIETALPGPEFQKICNRVWFISVNPEVRIERLRKNRGYSEEYAASIIRKQPKDDLYRQYADLEINNNGTPDELKRRVLDQL